MVVSGSDKMLKLLAMSSTPANKRSRRRGLFAHFQKLLSKKTSQQFPETTAGFGFPKLRSSPHNFTGATASVGSPSGEKILEVASSDVKCRKKRSRIFGSAEDDSIS
jgi:hypothetical protein